MSENRFSISVATEFKKKIKSGELPDDKIKNLIDSGKLDAQELITEGVLTQKRLDEIYYVGPAKHKERIRNREYSYDQIRALIDQNILDELDLVAEGILTQDQIDIIIPRPKAPIYVDFGDWQDVPPLKPNRVDVFVLGLAASGKSVFMSGLIYYAHSKGRLFNDIDNPVGAKYADTLIYAVKNRLLPPGTPVDYIQYMACDFIDKEGKEHPLTFLEMSGEIFRKLHFSKENNVPQQQQFKSYLFSANRKIIFLTIDYFLHSERGRIQDDNISQSSRFEYILQFFEKNGTLRSTEAICILITKWDLCKSDDNSAAANFLQREYLNLINLTKRYQAQYGFKFEVYTFTLGNFDERNNYEFVERDSEFIFNWLCSFSPVTNKEKGGGFFSRFLK